MQPKSFTANIFLKEAITENQRRDYFEILIKNDFLGYDYESGNYIAFDDVLKKYPERPRYLGVHKSNSFGISCAEGNHFITCRIDSDNEDSKIIISIIDEFCKITAALSFGYIDCEGDSPDNFEHDLQNTELKWLFKQNYFEVDFIHKYGKDFFLHMPCEGLVFITENCIRVDLSKGLFKIADKHMKETMDDYLQKYGVKARYYNDAFFSYE